MATMEQQGILTTHQLRERIVAVDESVLLIPHRILRRLIRSDWPLPGRGIWIPHRKSYHATKEDLLKWVELDEIGLDDNVDLPDHLILLPETSTEQLAKYPDDQLLNKYWRLLFHIRIHCELEKKIELGELTEKDIEERIDQIGLVAFDEIKTVLVEENFMLPKRDFATEYIEFLSVYLELRYFASQLVDDYFPSLTHLENIDEIIGQDIDAEKLFNDTRIPGSLEPTTESIATIEDQRLKLERHQSLQSLKEDSKQYPKLIKKAHRSQEIGNSVRAAIRFTQASYLTLGQPSYRAKLKARKQLLDLIHRLQRAVGFGDEAISEWEEVLYPLLEQAARGKFNSETRLLLDLQTVCIENEREIYTVDVIGWVMSRGESPVKRPLECQREVLICRRLRRAVQRIPVIRLIEQQRKHLNEMLRRAVVDAEVQLRDRFRSKVYAAIEESKSIPRNIPEKVALDKIVEEILDQVVERGFLSLGDLRDAISRNNIKLPDVDAVQKFFGGDRLLKTDKALSQKLAGVYRRGEFYLRWQQSASSLLFGTSFGRFATRYFFIPFIGAYLILAGLQHSLAILVDKVASNLPLRSDYLLTRGLDRIGVGKYLDSVYGPMPAFDEWIFVGLLGLFILAVLYIKRYRAGALLAWRYTKRFFRYFFLILPKRMMEIPILKAILTSTFLKHCLRFFVWPFLVTLIFVSTIDFFLRVTTDSTFPLMVNQGAIYLMEEVLNLGSDAATIALRHQLVGVFYACLFIFFNAVINSRLGRDAEEFAIDFFARGWNKLSTVIPGLFRFIVEISKTFLEQVERFLYAVDEILQFRSGEPRLSMIVKGALGIVWFYVTFVTRFCVNLLIEPQVNPIKHFPVVTVTHKISTPFIVLYLPPILEQFGLDSQTALTASVTIAFIIPGIFGYLAWEMKESWRLYDLNRPEGLEPAIVGSHGETMSRLLRPGFHSGTLPKLYYRLRRADRKAFFSLNWSNVRKFQQQLHHVQTSVKNFFERDLLALLKELDVEELQGLSIGQPELSVNSIKVRIRSNMIEGDDYVIEFTEQTPHLVAKTLQIGWTENLSPESRVTFETALAGLYRFAKVDIVNEHIDQLFLPQTPKTYVAEEGLVVWMEHRYLQYALYPLDAKPAIIAPVFLPKKKGKSISEDETTSSLNSLKDLPNLTRKEIFFSKVPIAWKQWCQVWNRSENVSDEVNLIAPNHGILPQKSVSVV